MPPSEPVLEGREISVVFGGVAAVANASIHARPGMIHGLIGPNGAGKTTLFDALGGMVTPASGRVVLDGADVTNWAPERRAAAGIGRTFQRLELFTQLTALENCMVGGEARSTALSVFDDVLGLPRARRARTSAERRAREILEHVGLGWAADRRAGELPPAAGRVLEFARALCTEPRVLLLDEPSSGLSPSERAGMGDLIVTSARERGMAVVLVEHDVELVARVCDRVWVMDAGECIAEGTPLEIRADPRVRAAYLGQTP